MQVATVLGTVDSTDLGQTLMHEHISSADWALRMNLGDRYYRHQEVADRAVAQFRRAREVGVRTVLDGTPPSIGRDVALIREVAERSGVNFIASSGFYFHEETYLRWGNSDGLYELLSSECADGIGSTGIRAGAMKAACADHGVTPTLERGFSVIGRVAAEQGVPVFVHHHPSEGDGQTICDIFEASGASSDQLILGHAGDSNDLDYLEGLLARGCYLGLDRFGYATMPKASNGLAERIATLAELCRRGFSSQLLLSHDLATFVGLSLDWQEFADGPEFPDVDFTFIHRTVLPLAQEAGVDADTLRSILADNPRRIFEAAALRRSAA
ncbi:phosphotriesterase [Nocardioides sp. Bht2]|uniref:phosphotriesterase family protein n=1 Tax=Nocardioides sp. Bht2 TaxID=3392297 RepID=UPI0039B4BF04